jgi:hypothetical protein
MKSTEFLQSAMDVQQERGEQYDKPSGERSMGATVRAFNAITGRDLSEAEGWLLLQTLKDVRQWQNPDRYHHDSALDGVAYSALKAEALSEQCDNQEVIVESIPSWDDAPEWASHLMVANFKISPEKKYQFAIKKSNGYHDDVDYSSRFITDGQKEVWAVYEARPATIE